MTISADEVLDALPAALGALAASAQPGPDGRMSHDDWALVQRLLDLAEQPEDLARALSGEHEIQEQLTYEDGQLDTVALLENFSGEKKDKRGRRICYSDGKRVPCSKLAPEHVGKTAERPKADAVHAHYEQLKAGKGDIAEFAKQLTGLTRDDLRALQKKVGAKGAEIKADLVRKIVVRAEAEVEEAKKKVKPPPPKVKGGAKAKAKVMSVETALGPSLASGKFLSLKQIAKMTGMGESEVADELAKLHQEGKIEDGMAGKQPGYRIKAAEPETEPKKEPSGPAGDVRAAVENGLASGAAVTLADLTKAAGGKRDVVLAQLIELRKENRIRISTDNKGRLVYKAREPQADPIIAADEGKPPLKAPTPAEASAQYDDSLPALDLHKPPQPFTSSLGGASEIKPPQTIKDLHELRNIMDLGGEAAKKAVRDYFGLDDKAIEPFKGDYQPEYSAVVAMVKRLHNPVAVAHRIASNSQAHAKVQAIVAMGERDTQLDRIINGGSNERSKLYSEVLSLESRVGWKKGQDKEEAAALYAHLKAEYERRLTERESARAERDKAKAEIRQKVHDLLKLPGGGERPSVRPEELSKVPAGAHLHQSIQDGQAWLADVIASAPGKTLAGYGIERVEKGLRAHYLASGHEMQFDVNDGAGVVVHEFCHGVEHTLPGIHEAIKDFLAHRCKDEPMQKLKDVFPDVPYDDWEVGRKDRFDAAFGDGSSAYYVGKDYNRHGSSEVLTMGVEKLYNDPVGFARQDPEYCAFIVGLLNGSLRNKTIPKE